MGIKKKNLAAALIERSEANAAPASKVGIVDDAKDTLARARRTSREGQTNIAVWFPISVKFQLDELRLQVSRQRGRKVSLTELQAEAYNDLFKKYGMAEIASFPPK
ncbi:MAG: hypothetical protein GY862_18015 [Gammaproteobacteria bacterium]|nr:hypothetical protein [Gammaproteobacteria bacterium]